MSVIVYNFSWPSKGQRSCASTAEQRSAVLSLPLSRFGAVQMDGQTDRQQQAPSTSWGQTQLTRPALLFDLARGVSHCLNPLLVLSATLVFHESRLGSPHRGREAFGFGGAAAAGQGSSVLLCPCPKHRTVGAAPALLLCSERGWVPPPPPALPGGTQPSSAATSLQTSE